MSKDNKTLEKQQNGNSDFKAEIIKKLTAFYAYGDEFGYSNAELSRIRSCITKVEETPDVSKEDMLVVAFRWYKNFVPIGTQKSSAEIVKDFLKETNGC